MRNPIRSASYAVMALTLAAIAGAPALADKPSWAGGGDKGKAARDHRPGEARRAEGSPGGRDGYFADRHRSVVHEYYDAQYHAGNCPPGLAKKRNGCLPPGQAKKWQIGRPLPRDVVVYDVPPILVERLGPPPAGHRYVRVAADILLIAVGTGMVVDAIQDLGRM